MLSFMATIQHSFDSITNKNSDLSGTGDQALLAWIK